LTRRTAASAKRLLPAFFTLVGIAALAVAVGASLPAEAKKRKGDAKPVAAIPDPDNGEPMMLVVSLSAQSVDVYRGLTRITSSKVSTGMRGYATKAGVFSILEKRRHHRSNLYSGAPMPWMNRITWSGTALHAGVVPGYPASHGCIRLPFSFAPKLFNITTVGDNVVVARGRPEPQVIEHPALFQPLPPPTMPVIGKEAAPPKRQTNNEAVPAVPMTTPSGMVATAYPSDSATDIPSSLDVEAIGTTGADLTIEDTHVHAFNPLARTPADEDSHDSRPIDTAAKVSGHAIDEKNRPEPSIAQLEAVPAFRVPESAAARAASLAEAPAATELKPVGRAAVPAALEPVGSAALQVSLAKAPPEAAPVEANALPEIHRPPNVITAKLRAGAKAAAILAAEPRSTAPLRVLVTRRTNRDRIIGVQQILSELGYLDVQDFDGTFGRATAQAITAFQKANGLRETGAMSDELVANIYHVARKSEPPEGHLFVRQEFGQVFDTPVSFKDHETPLGTYVFVAMNFEPGDTATRWLGVNVQGDDPAGALDRIEISDDLRRTISERLTPGSSFIISDVAINTAGLKKGNDFVVWAKDMPAKVTPASLETTVQTPRRKKVRRSVQRPSYSYRSRRSGPRGGVFWPF
jgi:hypothetical protein